ncbi:hypothetical protein G7054_g12492 [Neopestalotiopsis clavispora]|nr:hypothetical protein G7054_g12492 [Neopestalotiopsis clavispora]
MATPDATKDDIRYEQLVRHLLRSVKDIDNPRRQTDIRRLLEEPLPSATQQQPQPHHVREVAIHVQQQQQRLPQNFDGQSHDAVDQRWSPSGIKWRYARQGEFSDRIQEFIGPSDESEGKKKRN